MPICERCGKEHDGSFGSGRFCSKSCATRNTDDVYKKQHENAILNYKPKLEERICPKCGKKFTVDLKKTKRQYCSYKCSNSHIVTEQHKQKTRNSIYRYLQRTETINYKFIQINNVFKKIPKSYTNTCVICGNNFQTIHRSTKTCCIECRCKLGKMTKIKNGTYFNSGGEYLSHTTSKKGYYNGIFCGSTWELAWVIYNLDHNIIFYRNKDRFKYVYKNKTHYYTPDFLLDDGTYIEIKGYNTDEVEVKTNSVINKGKNIKVLYKKDLSVCFDYVKTKYNISKFELLYDKK